jgi:DNA-binding IclR family transcriptional regulator
MTQLRQENPLARPALAASRAVDILNFLTAHPAKSFTLSELAAHVGINVASTHAVLAVLTTSGYVVRHPTRKTYALGPVLVAAGHATLERHPAIDLARDEIRKLARTSKVEYVVTTAVLAEIVVLVRAGPRQARGPEVGQRIPLVPPIGSVFVAWGTPRERSLWLARARSATDEEKKRDEWILDTVRARGYSVTLRIPTHPSIEQALADTADQPPGTSRTTLDAVIDELGHGNYHLDQISASAIYDVMTIAAPVFDTEGQVMLAITANGFPGPLPASEIQLHADQLRDVALRVTREIRGRPPPEV